MSAISAGLEKVRTKVNEGESFFKRKYSQLIRIVHARDFLAECLGTFILVTFGDGAVAQFVFNKGSLSFLSVNAGYGIGLMIGVYMAAGVTGGHLNPAVTLAMALRGKTSWLKVIPYWIAQFLGAFVGAAVVYGAYVDNISNFDGLMPSGRMNPNCLTNGTLTPKLPLCTGGIFATYPSGVLGTGTGFFTELLGTFLLAIGIFGITDAKNSEVMSGLKPFMVGLTFAGVGTAFGFNTGYALNPARDLSPRIFTAIAGWGKDVFDCSQCSIPQFWWIPVVAPYIGAAIAALIYWFMVEGSHPESKEEEVNGSMELKRADTNKELVPSSPTSP